VRARECRKESEHKPAFFRAFDRGFAAIVGALPTAACARCCAGARW